MFGLISTKNLYLLKLDMVEKYDYINFDLGYYWLANNPRFTLARKYITIKEANFILQELNPTYLKENKRIRRKTN